MFYIYSCYIPTYKYLSNWDIVHLLQKIKGNQWATTNCTYIHNVAKLFMISCLRFWELVNYRISSYSFRGNYSFLDLEIKRSQYIRPRVTVHKCAETIQGRKLFKGGNYVRKYGIWLKFLFITLHQLRNKWQICEGFYQTWMVLTQNWKKMKSWQLF